MFLCSIQEDLRGQTDEDQVTDSEICTISASKLDSGKRKSAAGPEQDRSEG